MPIQVTQDHRIVGRKIEDRLEVEGEVLPGASTLRQGVEVDDVEGNVMEHGGDGQNLQRVMVTVRIGGEDGGGVERDKADGLVNEDRKPTPFALGAVLAQTV